MKLVGIIGGLYLLYISSIKITTNTYPDNWQSKKSFAIYIITEVEVTAKCLHNPYTCLQNGHMESAY